MYKTKSAKSKELLADALLELVGEMPLERISVKDVAARAGLNRQTFYYHFSSLGGLLDYVCTTRVAALSDYPDDGHDLRAVFDAVIAQIAQNRQLFRVLLLHAERRSLKNLLHDAAYRALAQQFDLLVGEGASATRQGGRIVEYGLLASASAIESWLLGETALSQDELSAWLASTFSQLVAGYQMMLGDGMPGCLLQPNDLRHVDGERRG